MLKSALFLSTAILLGASIASAAPPPDIDRMVDEAMRVTGTPGVGLAIVENGRTALAKGYGVRRLGSDEKVDADTQFPTGSTGKAFTVAALAVLVDQGKLKWDDKVTDRLPGFQMYDPWVTREMTVRDLLVHRSGLGLGAGDLLFVPRSDRSRADTVHSLRYIKPATSFRSGYAYDNVLYMVAGQMIEAITGHPWERFIQEAVLRPAGMMHATPGPAERFANANRAQLHARLNGPMRGVGEQQVLVERDAVMAANAAPAGGMTVSPKEVARWLEIQLAHGALPEGNGRLFSEAASKEMWTPRTLIPLPDVTPELAPTAPQFWAYALGWNVMDYKGHKIISHLGDVFGALAETVLLPEKNVGFAIFVNAEEEVVRNALSYEILDHYLGEKPVDWLKPFEAAHRQQVADALALLKSDTAKRAKAGPSLPASRYVGTYVDPWYGQIAITESKGKLWVDFQQTPNMKAPLEHWQYDTFKAEWTDKTIEPAFLTFSLDADGNVERIRCRAVSPLADFSYDYQDLDFHPAEPK